MPPRKRKEVLAPGPPRKRTQSETAKAAPDSAKSGVPGAKKQQVRPRMRPVPPPSPSPPVIDIEDEGDTEAGGSSSQSNQRRLVHWAADTKPGGDSDVDEMINDLLSSDTESEVDELESSPEPERVRRKITPRLGSKQANPSWVTTQENDVDPLVNDNEITVAYESPDQLAFAIQKDRIQQRTIGVPLDINYADFCMRVANKYQVAAHGMDLIYKTNRMAKSDSWCGLGSICKDGLSLVSLEEI